MPVEITWGDWGTIGGVVLVGIGLVVAYLRWLAAEATKERWKRSDDTPE